MTDNDIIKALEYCFTNDWNRTKCDKCCFYTGTTQCIEDLKVASIDLITRQKEEIERLKDYPYTTQIEVSKKIESQIKSEAITEFAERLKENINKRFDEDNTMIYRCASIKDIDNLVKEMVGEDND